MELEGSGATARQTFYVAKSHWKRRLKQEFFDIEEVFRRIQLRHPISMGELYDWGHHLRKLAAEGYDHINTAARLRCEERVIKDIVRAMGMAQLYSETLKSRCESLNYPVRTFPTFVCEVSMPGSAAPKGASDRLKELTLDRILNSDT